MSNLKTTMSIFLLNQVDLLLISIDNLSFIGTTQPILRIAGLQIYFWYITVVRAASKIVFKLSFDKPHILTSCTIIESKQRKSRFFSCSESCPHKIKVFIKTIYSIHVHLVQPFKSWTLNLNN